MQVGERYVIRFHGPETPQQESRRDHSIARIDQEFSPRVNVTTEMVDKLQGNKHIRSCGSTRHAVMFFFEFSRQPVKEFCVVTERFLSIWHLCAIGGCELAMVSAFLIVPRMGEQCVGISHVWGLVRLFSEIANTHRFIFSSTNCHCFENDGVCLWNCGILSKWVGKRLVAGGGAHLRWTVTFSWE